jgi:hypothetical protein
MIASIRWFSATAFVATTMLLSSSASAAIISYDFSGTVSQASNLGAVAEPVSNGFFQAGQAFSGTVIWDTDGPGFGDEFSSEFELMGFNINIGGMDFSSRFFPRLVGRQADGTLSFVSGGADQGGGASLTFNLGTYAIGYPTLAQLNGKVAEFSYRDFQPFGGTVSGVTSVAAVPEPATWAMMIIGIAAGGVTMRRRRPAAAALA